MIGCDVDLETYAVEAAVEANHWWFVGRRDLFGRVVAEFVPSRSAPVLDVGTSTGTNLRLLGSLGYENVQGVDCSDEAIRFCAEKGLGRVWLGHAYELPFPENSFRFVFATDVIEHLDDDVRALREIQRVLVPGGKVLITVPAFQNLWGLQDERAGHKRRYQRDELLARVREAGLCVVRLHYFNYILFVAIFVARRAMRRIRPTIHSENEINTPLLNRLLTSVFRLDVRTAPRLRPPFGVSLLVVAEKPSP